jgi:hypothetical protein
MTTIGTSSLYSGTINGLNSLDLDTLNVSDLDVNNIDGDFFSINTIECNDLQVDNEIDLTANGFITIGKNTPSQITITDTELGYLDGVSSNIQNQLDTLTTDLDTAETNISTLQTDLNTAESEIDTLQTDVNALETLTENVERVDVRLKVNQTIDIRDAFVDNTIENVFPSFTYFDKNIIFSRSSGYREYFLGMTGDNTNASNRFAIACNDSNGTQEPEILLEIPKGGNLRVRNGISIYDLLGNQVGTINNYSDSPSNSTFSIITQTGNMFLQTNSLLDCWTPAVIIGQTGGSTLTMRTDSLNTNRSKIVLDDITIFGGLGNVANDAYIQLNGETQNHAYTDADHTAVNGIANIETDVATNTTNIATNTTNIATNTTNIATNTFNLTATRNDYFNFKANIISRFQGGSYKMPFHVFKSTDGQIPFASAGYIDCFRMDLNPGFSRNDLIYLKVCMRHYTTFNLTTSPYSMTGSQYRGYYDGVWILSPKELSAPIRWGTTPIGNANTGNPISGGSGYGPFALDTSETINAFGHVYYQEAGSIVDGNWGSGTSNNVITFYVEINNIGQTTIIFRYLPITHTGTTPSTRNQNISGTIELLSGVDTNGGAITTRIVLSAYNANGGLTFNSNNFIDEI